MNFYKISLISLGILFSGQVIIKMNEILDEAKEEIKKKNYYFYQPDTDKYVQADKQRFQHSLFSGLVNCYFWKDNKKYSTCDYYKPEPN